MPIYQERLDFLKGEHGKTRYTRIESQIISVDEALKICRILNPGDLLCADLPVTPNGISSERDKGKQGRKKHIIEITD